MAKLRRLLIARVVPWGSTSMSRSAIQACSGKRCSDPWAFPRTCRVSLGCVRLSIMSSSCDTEAAPVRIWLHARLPRGHHRLHPEFSPSACLKRALSRAQDHTTLRCMQTLLCRCHLCLDHIWITSGPVHCLAGYVLPGYEDLVQEFGKKFLLLEPY